MAQAIILGGPLVKAGAPTSGVFQVETAVVVGAITTAGVAGDYRGSEEGTFLLDTTNLAIYRNDGTTARPVWTAI